MNSGDLRTNSSVLPAQQRLAEATRSHESPRGPRNSAVTRSGVKFSPRDGRSVMGAGRAQREYPPLDRAAGSPSTVTAGHTTGRVAGDRGGRHGHARSGAWPSKLPGGLPPELAITMGR